MSDIDPSLRVRRELSVSRNPQQVWAFVSDMGNWASQMPGYLSHEEIDRDRSMWTLQVDIGPFQRPVPVEVQVLKWDEPTHVSFTIRGRQDPFVGEGAFHSSPNGRGTSIVLEFGAQPTGSMARMLLPLVRPILDRTADEFTTNLAQTLDAGSANAPAARPGPPPHKGFWARLIARLVRPRATPS